MERKRSTSRVVDSTSSINGINTEMQKKQEEWISLKERRHQDRKDHLLDFGNEKVTWDEEKHEKKDN